jgi:hypothetical protein
MISWWPHAGQKILRRAARSLALWALWEWGHEKRIIAASVGQVIPRSSSVAPYRFYRAALLPSSTAQKKGQRRYPRPSFMPFASPRPRFWRLLAMFA